MMISSGNEASRVWPGDITGARENKTGRSRFVMSSRAVW